MSFRLPHLLFKGWELAKSSRLVNRHEIDEESLNFFIGKVNNAQPSADNVEDMAYYNLTRALYRKNPNRFLQLIRGNNMECLMLWTQGRVIVNELKIKDLVYLNWNTEENKYDISLIEKDAESEMESEILTMQSEEQTRNEDDDLGDLDDLGSLDDMSFTPGTSWADIK